MPRTPRDKAVDHLLTIYLVNDAFSRRKLRFLPETKLQKLVFLSEKSMIDERKKGFNFYFVKLIHGPFSQELKNGLGKLLQTRFLNDFGLMPTDHAKMILEDFQDVIKRNRTFFQKIDTVNEHFATMSLERLLKLVYAMPWGRGRTIEDLPLRTPMLYPMKPSNVVAELEITDDEVEDLLMNFNPEAVKELSQAMSEMREGRTLTYEQVFSNLY